MSSLVITCCLVLSTALAAPPLRGGGCWEVESSQKERSASDPALEPFRSVPKSEELVPRDTALSDEAKPLPLYTSLQTTTATLSLTPGQYYVTSPNYPENYINDYHFTYPTFIGAQGQELRISCPSFEVEPQRTCSYDWLSINGSRFCGLAGIAERRAFSLAIEFHTDESVNFSGFVCYITVPLPDCCGRANRRSRIVGGEPTEEHEYPWQAGVVGVGSNRTWCGGSLINSRYVLTAAHCTASANASRIEVLLGDHWIGQPDAGEARFSVADIIIHPNYTTYTGGNDFSLLRLTTPAIFSEAVRPVCLPTVDEMFGDVTAMATGFGRTASSEPQSEVLREVELPVWNVTRCAAFLPNLNTTTMVCAGGAAGQATCNGDSGGPLVVSVGGRYTVIGVTSFGYVPCGLKGYPSVYARVSTVLSWIEQNTKDATLCG